VFQTWSRRSDSVLYMCFRHDPDVLTLFYTCVSDMIQTFWLCFIHENRVRTSGSCLKHKYKTESQPLDHVWNTSIKQSQNVWIMSETHVDTDVLTLFYTCVSDMIQTFWLCFIHVFQTWSRGSDSVLYLCFRHDPDVLTLFYTCVSDMIQTFLWIMSEIQV
jgi:hypothetical protein